jgi:exopolyphosphatase / guanosine-5'-triphosphate,3'-diphosphate pyrophosphatase
VVTSAAPRAALDVGSNTIRLLVARVSHGSFEPLVDESEFVRLGKGVDASGRLQEDRMVAAIEAIRTLVARASGLGADAVIAVATSAVRDASNRVEFVHRVAEATGVKIRILSGDEEARLTYLGAVLGNPVIDGTIICDLGGGSSELIFASPRKMEWARSLQFGSGRLTEQFVHHDPPAAVELEEVRRRVRELLLDLPEARATDSVLTGGTASHIGYLLGKGGDQIRLDAGDLERVLTLIRTKTVDELVAEHGVRRERAEVLSAGITAATAIVEYYGTPRITITQRGIREGAIVDSLQVAGTQA